MADEVVRLVQRWLNLNYNFGIEEDGYTGSITVNTLRKALQVELGFSASELDGSFGPATESAFNSMFPNGLHSETNPLQQNKKNIIYILRGGMYCRGIDGGNISFENDDCYKFTSSLELAIQKMKSQLGLQNPDSSIYAREMKAVLTTDAYTLIDSGDIKVREIQQALNRKYLGILKYYLPTNGLYERNTNMAIKKAIQSEIGVTVDGSWGNGTKNALPALTVGSNKTNLIYLLQYLLYLNGFDPNGFDGSFGNGAKNAVMNFQELMHLDVDGSVGPQTWFALVLSCGDTSRKANACDTRFEITPARAQTLKNNGYQVIGRYINGGSFKELREGELQVIFNAGLKVFFIFQENNRLISDFGYNNGYSAGLKASRYARKHHLPDNAIIYFAVDLDVYEDQIADYIIPFFKGICDALDDNFKVGIYGPRLVCQRVSDENLAISSFVANMSTGYSCNIGQKMPSNWCYDQFTEISNFNNDFDIDKVIYRGNIPAFNTTNEDSENDYTLSKNEEVFEYLMQIYNHANNYCKSLSTDEFSTSYINSLVLQYLREKSYNGAEWALVTGETLDSKWLNYINGKMSDNRFNEYIYINNLNKIGLIHMAVVTESNLINSSTRPNNNLTSAIKDLSGWAGDLLSFAAELDANKKSLTLNQIIDRLGTKESKSFDLEDFFQDIDAVNTYKALVEKPIYEVYREYYNTNSSRTRFTKFINYIRERGTLPSNISQDASDYDLLYHTAYQYLDRNAMDDSLLGSINATLQTALEVIFKHYDEEVWADLVAQAFATKLENLSKAEIS